MPRLRLTWIVSGGRTDMMGGWFHVGSGNCAFVVLNALSEKPMSWVGARPALSPKLGVRSCFPAGKPILPVQTAFAYDV